MAPFGRRVSAAWLPIVGVALQLATLATASAWTVHPASAARFVVPGQGHDVFALVPFDRPDGAFDVVKVDDRRGRVRWHHRRRVGRGGDIDLTALLAPAGGDAIIAGMLNSRRAGAGMFVARLAGRNGRERWRRLLQGRTGGSSNEEIEGAALDPNGDVIVGGGLVNGQRAGDYQDFTVIKLAGQTGRELWRFTLDGPQGSDRADALAVDGRGDVIAGGSFVSTPFGPIAHTVVKLDGGTGALRWRRDLSSDVLFGIDAVAVDASGDAYVATTLTDSGGDDFGVVKLAGDTGAERWRARESASSDRFERASRVIVDALGNVFAGGRTDDGSDVPTGNRGELFTVVRLDGGTGSRVWAYRTGGHLQALAPGPAGTVLAGGSRRDGTTCEDGWVVALSAETGAPLWSVALDGTFTAATCTPECEEHCPPVDDDSVTALGVGSGGRVIAAGDLLNARGRRPRLAPFLRTLAPAP